MFWIMIDFKKFAPFSLGSFVKDFRYRAFSLYMCSIMHVFGYTCLRKIKKNIKKIVRATTRNSDVRNFLAHSSESRRSMGM